MKPKPKPKPKPKRPVYYDIEHVVYDLEQTSALMQAEVLVTLDDATLPEPVAQAFAEYFLGAINASQLECRLTEGFKQGLCFSWQYLAHALSCLEFGAPNTAMQYYAGYKKVKKSE